MNEKDGLFISRILIFLNLKIVRFSINASSFTYRESSNIF